MKKIAVLLVLIALICVGCAPTENPNTTDDTKPPVSDTEGDSDTAPDTDEVQAFSFLYKEVRLTPGAHLDVVSSLGEPMERAEAPSCLHAGNDTVYFYEDVEIVTSPSDQGEYIVSVTFLSPTVTTEEEIALGANISDALTALGDAEEAFGRYLFTRGNTTLTMMTDDDGVIVSISYALAE